MLRREIASINIFRYEMSRLVGVKLTCRRGLDVDFQIKNLTNTPVAGSLSQLKASTLSASIGKKELTAVESLL